MIARVLRYLFAATLIPAAVLAQTTTRAPAKKVASKPAQKVTATPARFALAASGNHARFIVREQLMTLESPNDAIGTTTAITGGIAFNAAGKIDPAMSRIVIAMDSIATDKENRDKWIRSHTLRTDSFPTATIVVRELNGLPAKLPAAGTFAVKLVGDLTIHGVTRPWTWDVTLNASGNDYTGTATTHLKFGDFGMDQPRLMIVVSVVDDVKLEYEFHFIRQL